MKCERALDKYGFGKARSFFLVEGGRKFDSKAIAGAAHGYQHGHPLKSKDFSGRERCVARVLKLLDLVVLRDEPDVSDLVAGAKYSRSELHDRFGGQEQGGIATPTSSPVILAFTGSSGAQHGYTDGWSEGVVCYFGEGQAGDMTFTKDNLAIRSQAESGKEIRLLIQLHFTRRLGIRSLRCTTYAGLAMEALIVLMRWLQSVPAVIERLIMGKSY